MWILYQCPKTRTRMAEDRSRRIRTPFRPVFLYSVSHHCFRRSSNALGCCEFAFSTSTSNQYWPRMLIWYMLAARPSDNHTIDCQTSLEIHQRPIKTIFSLLLFDSPLGFKTKTPHVWYLIIHRIPYNSEFIRIKCILLYTYLRIHKKIQTIIYKYQNNGLCVEKYV